MDGSRIKLVQTVNQLAYKQLWTGSYMLEPWPVTGPLVLTTLLEDKAYVRFPDCFRLMPRFVHVCTANTKKILQDSMAFTALAFPPYSVDNTRLDEGIGLQHPALFVHSQVKGRTLIS